MAFSAGGDIVSLYNLIKGGSISPPFPFRHLYLKVVTQTYLPSSFPERHINMYMHAFLSLCGNSFTICFDSCRKLRRVQTILLDYI